MFPIVPDASARNSWVIGLKGKDSLIVPVGGPGVLTVRLASGRLG
jgi:hypothetical protein